MSPFDCIHLFISLECSYNRIAPVFNGVTYKGYSMLISQIKTFGMSLIPVEDFNATSQVKFHGSLEKFVYTYRSQHTSSLLMCAKTVSELTFNMLEGAGKMGYTPDMIPNLLQSMLLLSNLESSKLSLSLEAIEEVKYLLTLKNPAHEIAQYQLASTNNGILVIAPEYTQSWVEYFQKYVSEIVEQENRSRIERIYSHGIKQTRCLQNYAAA